MDNSRTKMLIGEDGSQILRHAHVLIVGLGGVGGYVLEGLVRAGVGKFTLVDGDYFSQSNLNRQILATIDTVGQSKVEVAALRAKSINDEVVVIPINQFWTADDIRKMNFGSFDFVVDCIDTVTSKIALCETVVKQDVRIISVMGSGNKLSTDFQITDISKTSVCPLARVMRKELKVRGVYNLKVVYSNTECEKVIVADGTRHVPGSISFAPAIAGMKACEYVITTLLGVENN